MDPALASRVQQCPSPMAQIGGRILVHAGVDDLGAVAQLIDSDCSGLVLTRTRRNGGKSNARLLMSFRDEHPEVPVLVDAAAYVHSEATIDSPFELAADLFGGSLFDNLDGQLSQGAPIAITPTRFIRLGEVDVLRAVLARTDELQRNDTLCLLPLSAKWLNTDNYKYLADELQHVTVPVALILEAPMDPMRTKYARTGLRDLLTDFPGTSLLRTDLAAFEVLSRTGRCASIGIRASLRHLNKGGYVPQQRDRKRDTSADVLVPELLRWFKGSYVGHACSKGSPVTCGCRVCRGGTLDRFGISGSATRLSAERHAIACWMPWAHEIADIESHQHKQRWWQSKTARAIQAGSRWRNEHAVVLEDSPVIRFWADI